MTEPPDRARKSGRAARQIDCPAHQAATGLGLVGMQRFGFFGVAQIHAVESTTYRRPQEKPRPKPGQEFLNGALLDAEDMALW